MREMRPKFVASALLAFASYTSAQVASVCPSSDVCFKLNIPANTASSGQGDIFFQLSAPSSYEWVALGQGTAMAGSNIFIVYTSSSSNVTLSPRLASGHTMPTFNSNAKVTLLEGSGVSDGKMVANVKCSNCNSWNGGTADFTASNGNWVYAVRTSGGPKNSADTAASIVQHSTHDRFSWSYANAKGGDSVNPLLNAAPSGTGSTGATATSCVPRPASTAASSGSSSRSGSATSTAASATSASVTRPFGFPTASPTGRFGPPEKRQQINYCDDSSNGFTSIGQGGGGGDSRMMLIAHGVLAALAFVILFPSGAIAIRLASFPGTVWFHAAFQVFAYIVYIAAFGLGVHMAKEYSLLNHHHPIIGIVVFVCLFVQPILGFVHHSSYKKHQVRTLWSHAHLWLGRLVITLGIINGGLGLRLADSMGMSSKSGIIAYGVVAGVMWLTWVAASIIGERRRKMAPAHHTPKSTGSPRIENGEMREGAHGDIPHPSNGHYAPN